MCLGVFKKVYWSFCCIVFHVSIKLFLEFNWFFFGGYIFWRMLKQVDLYCSSTIYGSLLHAVSIEFLLLDNDLDNNL